MPAPAPPEVEIIPLRKSLRLTQSDVAKRLGLSASYICHVERRVLIRPDVEAKIRRLLLRLAAKRVS